jgi:hypothetical protein
MRRLTPHTAPARRGARPIWATRPASTRGSAGRCRAGPFEFIAVTDGQTHHIEKVDMIRTMLDLSAAHLPGRLGSHGRG